MKISVFTVMIPKLTPEEAVQELALAGYAGVEWRVTRVPTELRTQPPSFWGNNYCTLEPGEEDARRARKLAAEARLSMPSLGTYISVGDLEAVEQAMRFARTAGVPQIRVGVSRTGSGTYADGFLASRAFMDQVAELAHAHGIKALVETHPGTIAASASATVRLVEKYDPEQIGVIYDPGNLVHEGYEDYAMGLELLGPYLAHVHLKNAAFERPPDGGVWQARPAPLDDGVVDFPRLFQALALVDYDGWLGLEDFSVTRTVHEALRFNIHFVQDLMDRYFAAGT